MHGCWHVVQTASSLYLNNTTEKNNEKNQRLLGTTGKTVLHVDPRKGNINLKSLEENEASENDLLQEPE